MYIYEHYRDKDNCITAKHRTDISSYKHFHNCIEFVYVLDGKADIHIDECTWTVESGQLLACPSLSTHYYDNVETGSYIVILIPRRYFREYETVFSISGFTNPVIPDTEDKKILTIMNMISNLANGIDIYGNPLGEDTKDFQENSLILLSSYLVNLCIQHCGIKERQRYSSLVADAVNIIEENFKNELTIATICKKIGCNQKDLSYHFKKTMNMSIINYIERTRVFEAARLLTSNIDMTVESVMLQSGFRSNRSFLRHFKNIFGCTPTEYKTAHVKKK